MADYDLVYQVSDMGQMFDIVGEDYSSTVHTGPMDREQLVRDYLAFGFSDALPERFLFADIGYTGIPQQGLGSADLRNFLRKGMAHGKTLADKFSTRFEEVHQR